MNKGSFWGGGGRKRNIMFVGKHWAFKIIIFCVFFFFVVFFLIKLSRCFVSDFFYHNFGPMLVHL